MTNQDTRDYLAEARAILRGTTSILPERLHLLALELAHAQEIVTIYRDMEGKLQKFTEVL